MPNAMVHICLTFITALVVFVCVKNNKTGDNVMDTNCDCVELSNDICNRHMLRTVGIMMETI